MATYVDSVAAVRAWINGRTTTLVGSGKPLQKGAHLRHLDGAASATYALIEEVGAVRSDDAAEDPDMVSILSAQVYGGTREAATAAAVALAEELSSQLCGCAVAVTGATLFVADDIQGPTWAPDEDVPRLIVQFSVRLRPA
jgi:hypothetical protein